MKYYISDKFRNNSEDCFVTDELGTPLFKVWKDRAIKLGEMGAVVMSLTDEELYTIAEKKMTCLVYKGEDLIAECSGGTTQPYL